MSLTSAEQRDALSPEQRLQLLATVLGAAFEDELMGRAVFAGIQRHLDALALEHRDAGELLERVRTGVRRWVEHVA